MERALLGGTVAEEAEDDLALAAELRSLPLEEAAKRAYESTAAQFRASVT